VTRTRDCTTGIDLSAISEPPGVHKTHIGMVVLIGGRVHKGKKAPKLMSWCVVHESVPDFTRRAAAADCPVAGSSCTPV
jgi:hypothetical protein